MKKIIFAFFFNPLIKQTCHREFIAYINALETTCELSLLNCWSRASLNLCWLVQQKILFLDKIIFQKYQIVSMKQNMTVFSYLCHMYLLSQIKLLILSYCHTTIYNFADPLKSGALKCQLWSQQLMVCVYITEQW